MTDPTKPPCTSVSNCLVVRDLPEGGVMLHSSRRPGGVIMLDTDEWEAHLAEVRAAALTEAADFLAAEWPGDDTALHLAANILRSLASQPSATEPADDAPPVPEQAPEAQGPAQTPEGFEDHPLTVRLGRWWCGCGGWIASTDGREAMIDHAVHVHVALGLAVEDDEPPTPMAALAEPHATIAKLAEDLDTARAAAEGFRDELNRTGEQLLAMTAERDQLAKALLSVYARTERRADPFAPDPGVTRLTGNAADRRCGFEWVAADGEEHRCNRPPAHENDIHECVCGMARFIEETS